MNELQVFGFEGRNVRVVEKGGNPWWVAKDVADILEYSDTEAMTRKMDDDEVMTDKLSGMNMNSTFINESGVYSAILRSSKPEAKAFKKWITSEVLPSIRKTGSYGTPLNPNLSISAPKLKELRVLFESGAISKAEIRAFLFTPTVGIQKPYSCPVQISASPIADLLNKPEFSDWKIRLDTNGLVFERMGIIRRVLNRQNVLLIHHNHKALTKIAGSGYKTTLRSDPAYIETKSVRIAENVETSLVFSWDRVTGDTSEAHK